MKILLLGKYGQVGWELHHSLLPLGEIIAIDYPEIDLENENQTRQLIRNHQPQIIINATAYTNVEQAEKEPDLAFAINATAPGILAEEAKRLGAALVHYSTDFVFDGEKGIPYFEEDTPNPINIYGESKLAGERAVRAVDGAYLILRTSWVYSLRRECFLSKVLRWSREHKSLRMVTDQVGSPTWSRVLAEATVQILPRGGRNAIDWLSERKGLYHLAGNGNASRIEWCRSILENDPHKEEQIVTKILPALSSDFQTLAERPQFSALNCDRFAESFGLNLPDWTTSLALAMKE